MPSLLDFFETRRPSAKRQKVSHNLTPDSPSAQTDDGSVKESDETHSQLPNLSRNDTDSTDAADLSVGNEDSGNLKSSQSDLEISLPPVNADEDAIKEYENAKAAEVEETEQLSLEQRLEERKWHKGKSSIYVDAFNLALETVLNEEAHLFDQTELDVFRRWQDLSYGAQYLYVRLFLRKTAAWHRINRLGYYHDIANMDQAVADLREIHPLSGSATPLASEFSELEQPDDMNRLGGSFRFAEGIEEITTLEEASSLLLLDELKEMAKEAKVQGKNKKELVAALLQTSQTQAGLRWNAGKGNNRDRHFHGKILELTGDCIRLSHTPLKLFERVHLVFYRSTEWTEKSLTTIILAKISRKHFPEYVVSRSTAIFPSRAALLEFEAALRTQYDIDNILEFGGTPTAQRLQTIKDLSEQVYPRWKLLLEQEQQKENSIYFSGEGAYLRRFSPAWVYTRIIHKGLYPLGRFKEYRREHELLTELLDQKLFHAARRGAWYQRKALLEEHYLWALTPNEGRSDEAQKKHWKRTALSTCEAGLQDPDCHVIYHYDLQKRIVKLEKSLKFGYLFYDILFTYVPNVFQTPFQTCPLDLHTDAFYPSRASEINHRLVQLANGEAESIIRRVHESEFPKQTCIVGVDWTYTLDDLVEIVQCFSGAALATVCKVMAQEYQQRGGGIPDLFLWNPEKKEVMFSEVKSENDRLSDTQRLWIHVLTGTGVKVELCNAVAREVRYTKQ
ncbi:hypothetical protein ZTR_04626 [Talaromyces verruculosus]|nr:hypothetical protein ZTR_04626 [Talaromyces verruculosus]